MYYKLIYIFILKKNSNKVVVQQPSERYPSVYPRISRNTPLFYENVQHSSFNNPDRIFMFFDSLNIVSR